MPTKKLARIVYADNNLMFKDVEDCRQTLRYIEGKKGERFRNHVNKTEFYMAENRAKNPYNLPESYEEKREPFVLPVCCNNILLISDLHIPYHNIEAVTIALNYGKKEKVNTFLKLISSVKNKKQVTYCLCFYKGNFFISILF
jgi:hypothetical protein